MKRLLLTGALAAAFAGTAAPANATIVICDNMPVMASCYWMGGGRWCTVYVARVGCVEDLFSDAGTAIAPQR